LSRDYITLSHGFDVLAEQVTYELAEVEAPDGTVARSQGGLIGFHAALAALFAMTDEGFDARSTFRQTAGGLRVTLRQRVGIKPRLLKVAFLQPFQRSQVLALGATAMPFVHPE
jgi:hypothetical protein